MKIEQFLEDLENRIDDAVEEDVASQWTVFWSPAEKGNSYFRPKRRRAVPSRLEWPQIPVNQAIRSRELMLLREMAQNSHVIASGGGQRLNIRCNYGTVDSAFRIRSGNFFSGG